MEYKPINLDDLPLDDLSDDIEICLGCGSEDCTCEPIDCAVCEGTGAVEIADTEMKEAIGCETEVCEACKGEGQFYPPRLTVGEIKKRKGYS